MKSTHTLAALVVASTALLSGCASNSSQPMNNVVSPNAKLSKNHCAPIGIPIPDLSPLNPPLGLVPPLPPKITKLSNTAHMSPIAALMTGLAYAGQHSDSVFGNVKDNPGEQLAEPNERSERNANGRRFGYG